MTLREYIEKLAAEHYKTQTGYTTKKELIDFLKSTFPELTKALRSNNNTEAIWTLYITEYMKYVVDDNS